MDFIGDCPLRHGMIPCRHVPTKKAHGHPSDLPQLGQLLHGSACGSTSGSCRGEPWWPKDLTCESRMMLHWFMNSMKSMNSMNLGFTKEREAVHYGKWRSAMIQPIKNHQGWQANLRMHTSAMIGPRFGGDIPKMVTCFSFVNSYTYNTLWLIAMERSTIFKNGKPVNHLFLWAIYTMAMLNNQRVFLYIYSILYVSFHPDPAITKHDQVWWIDFI